MKRIAVVTGAGSGIGAAIARELAARGDQVIVTDVNLESAQNVAASIGDAAAKQLDVTDPQQCAAVVAEIEAEFGQIDVWVSNAGVSRMKKFVDITEQDYDFTLDVNLKGVFFASQAAARSMVRSGRGGIIVNTASMAAKQGRVPYLADYVAKKGTRPCFAAIDAV